MPVLYASSLCRLIARERAPTGGTLVGDVQLGSGGSQYRHQLVGRLLVGVPGMDPGEIAQADHGVAADLGVVGAQDDLARVIDDGLGDADIVEIEVQQR